MKTWTVMLIPHDRGSTRTLTLSNTHIWVAVGTVAVLAFVAAFLLQRNLIVQHEVKALRVLNDKLAQEKTEIAVNKAKVEVPAPVTPESNGEEVREVEVRLKAQYEGVIKTLTTRLNEITELEKKVRDSSGLPARKEPAKQEVLARSLKGAGGKGGGEVMLAANYEVAKSVLPPTVIYGMNSPSADLILQEIELRKVSMSDLLAGITKKQDAVQRQPMIWPVDGRLTSRFGYRRDPFNRRIRYHSGTDIAAPTGTKVTVTGRGVVVSSTYDGDFGNIVRVDHGNGLETWYAHLSERLVKTGAKVERGQVIGKVGSTGRSTGPHLHYEVHKNGKTVDAEVYLK